MQIILSANKLKKYMANIVDVVLADRNLATMLKGFKAAGMENDLSKPGPFTVFAPIEIAFSKLPLREFFDLLKPENKIRLADVLNNHVVEGKINYKDFIDGQKLKTISGKELNVKVTNRNVTINGSAILSRDNDATNGVVHSLNRVISFN